MPPVTAMPAKGHNTAPVWNLAVTELETFLEDVKQLAEDRNQPDTVAIKFAVRYAPTTETPLWKELDAVAGADWDDFVKEVLELYPGAGIGHRYTKATLTDLVARQTTTSTSTREEFGQYYRSFLTVSKFLQKKKKLSDDERDELFYRGFPPALGALVQTRLSIKHMDHDREDPYPIAYVKAAAEYVLGGSNTSMPAAAVPTPAVKQEETLAQTITALHGIVTAFTQAQSQPAGRQQAYAPAAPPPQSNYPPRIPWALSGANAIPVAGAAQPATSGYAGDRGPLVCHFCGKEGEFIRSCPLVQEYITSGRVVRDRENRLQLPNNGVMPYLRGGTLKDRVDAYYTANPGQVPVPPTNAREVAPHIASSNLMSIVVTPDAPVSAAVSEGELLSMLQGLQDITADDGTPPMLAVFEAAVAKIRKARFDGVELPARPGGTRPTRPAHPAPAAAPVKVTPITMPSDHAPQYQYRAPIEEDSRTAQTIIDRALDAQITLSTRDLLAVAPAVRKSFKDCTTTRKIAAGAEVLRSAYIETVPDDEEAPSASVFLNPQHPYPCAPRTAALRSVRPLFNGTHHVESILDSGSEVTCMRRAIWEKLAVVLSEDFRIGLQSADQHESHSVGEIQNLRVELGGVTSYHQFIIMEHASYDVLLGRPFFLHLLGVETNTGGEDEGHRLSITDPVFGTRVTIPTSKRSHDPIARTGF
ncbi:hypothetical protein FIBSPDRAFT_741239 [Athelia psychrophila]|uniref:CCHC-type domain-containing protein n=1 Tax=Athelia psychrophila TaxID=1759441 RepID=A0A166JML8_9AGAM|nr:hypothetical protein FIBSPDRAFT_741239 [Fibularhizoctonia sp. CBS 109695]